MIVDSTGIDRLAEAGVALSEANRFRTSCQSMPAIWRPAKYGRSWLCR